MQHRIRPRYLRTPLRRFWRDRSGNYLMITGLAAPVLLGLVAIGTEDGVWLYTHQTEQSAADAAAFSAAQNYSTNGAGGSVSPNANLITEAKGVAAGYGFVHGQNGVTLTLNRPPLAADFPKYSAYQNGVEVTITQVQPRLFSKLWNRNSVTITARSVAIGNSAKGCVLALNKTVAKAADSSGGGAVHIDNCDLYDDSTDSSDALNGGGSAIVYARFVGVQGGVTAANSFHTAYGLSTGFPYVPDPYADVPNQTTSSCNGQYSSKTETINPGCWKSMHFNGGNTITLNPGVYYVYGGAFQVDGGASLKCNCVAGGAGVTIVLTGDSTKGYATATVNGGGTISLQAPGKNSGSPLMGIVFFADRNAPVGTAYKFNGDSNTNYIGAIYAPKGAVTWNGGQATSTSCTQVIGDTVSFSGGGSNLAVNCDNDGTRPIGLNTMLAG